MKLSTFMLSLLASYTVAYQGEICSDDPDEYGTCELVSWCNKNGGNPIAGYCPDDPNDVECCFGPKCDGDTGFCWYTGDSFCSSLGGHYVANKCPGPDDYECCVNAIVN